MKKTKLPSYLSSIRNRCVARSRPLFIAVVRTGRRVPRRVGTWAGAVGWRCDGVGRGHCLGRDLRMKQHRGSYFYLKPTIF
jgi:hypothetical protein